MNKFNLAINPKRIVVSINVCNWIKRKLIITKVKEHCLQKIIDKYNQNMEILSLLMRIMKYETKLLRQ